MFAPYAEKLRKTKVAIREVGLREGLQSHQKILPTAAKVDIFRRLVGAGVREINAVAFVNPNRMPHMGDAEALLRALGSLRDGIDISGLVLSESGLKRALLMRREGLLDTIFLVFSPVADSMKANGITADPEALLAQIERCAVEAGAAGLKVGVFCSESFGSPNTGWVDPETVIATAGRITAMPGVTELIISDSTGQADPVQVGAFFDALSATQPLDKRLCFHVHDTRGAGMANILAALCSPFENIVLDTSFGGFGGDYPFIPDAFGNVATEDLAEMLLGMGVRHGIDPDAIMALAKDYAADAGRPLGSRLSMSSGSVAWKAERRAAAASAVPAR